MNFREAIRFRAAATPRRIVFPEADDPRIAEAVARLHADRLVVPVLVGEPSSVRAAIRQCGADPDAFEILDPATDLRRDSLAARLAERRRHRGWTIQDARERLTDPLIYACTLVGSHAADGCVAGAVHTTADVIRAALWGIGTSPGIATISSSFYMVVPPFRTGGGDEILNFTDAAVIADPDAATLADIAAAAVRARSRIVGDAPRVAFLSYSTKGSAAGGTVEKVRDAYQMFTSLHPDIAADGELQADAALIEAVALRKAPHSALRGQANILVFPNLDAGNIAYKLVQRLAHADAIGPVLQGLARPCSDLSRGASVDDIVAAACITALQSEGPAGAVTAEVRH